jgi:hypothetical protein
MIISGKRLADQAKVRRYRLRKAGLLPPIPRCDCGRQVRTDRWQGLCSTCARLTGLDTRRKPQLSR